jgi:hypothetical protein
MGGGILTKEDGRLDNRETSLGESTVTVKWWAVLVVILSIMGFFFISTMNHEGRLTKIETTFGYITSGLDEVKALTREIREDQVRRYQREVRENK